MEIGIVNNFQGLLWHIWLIWSYGRTSGTSLRYSLRYMCFSGQCIINKESKKLCVSGIWNLLVIFNANISCGYTVICKLNKMDLSRFDESKFASNHIFISLKNLLI